MFGGCGWFVAGAVALVVLRWALKTLDLYLMAWLDAKELLAEVHPPGEAELEAFVPPQYRNPGSEWSFTRGKLLSTSGSKRTGEYDVEYTRYDGVYGYYDHRGRLRLHRMESGDDDRAFRPGRLFIILYNRRHSREHRVFEMKRWW